MMGASLYEKKDGHPSVTANRDVGCRGQRSSAPVISGISRNRPVRPVSFSLFFFPRFTNCFHHSEAQHLPGNMGERESGSVGVYTERREEYKVCLLISPKGDDWRGGLVTQNFPSAVADDDGN